MVLLRGAIIGSKFVTSWRNANLCIGVVNAAARRCFHPTISRPSLTSDRVNPRVLN